MAIENPPQDRERATAGRKRALPGNDEGADDLITRCLAHDEGAWVEFLDRYQRLIHSAILKVGLPQDDREEAFQASIVAIYRQLPRLRNREKLHSWIVGIAWRQAINRIRSRRNQVSVETVDDQVLGRSIVPPGRSTMPDDARADLERAQQAQEALAALPARCRELLQLFFLEDPPPSYDEIARRFSAPIGSLGPTRARCLGKMRDFFRVRGWLA